METAGVTTESSDSQTHMTAIETSQGTVSLVQVTNIPGQAIQVQNSSTAVITAAQAAAHGIKAFQVISHSDGDTADEDVETKKRREILARRPSYRRILNELSGSDAQQTITVAKIEEESDSYDSSDDEIATNLSTSGHGVPIQPAGFGSPTSLKMMPGQTIQIGGDSSPGLQTLTMTNVSGSNGASPTGGATILQYAQSADGQFIIPMSALSSGSVQYQIAGTTASLPQGVVMATAGSGTSLSSHVPEQATRKRELRLLKNREAARECRRKKKEYVKCLENRVAVLENQNKTLIEELKSLKELYCQKDAQS